MLKKLSHVFLIALLLLGTASSLLIYKAYATAGILDHRQIKMSSSASGATNVMYSVSFKVGSTSNVGGIVIDFCAEDPIPNDTCSTPQSSFNTNHATTTINNPIGIDGTFAVDVSSTVQTMIITSGTPVSLTAGDTVSFDLGDGSTNGFTNPATTNTTFYARIFTYTTNAGATSYNTTTHQAGTYKDFGGIALTTTAQLSLTAKIEEQLTLCLYTGANCAGGVTAQYLGDANHILSVSSVYANANAKLDASTNAANGMIIYASGTTLTSPQSFTIAPIGASSAASSPGSEQFGFCVGTTGGSVNSLAPYNFSNANCNAVTTGANTTGSAQFAFDTSSSPNMTTLGGMPIASSNGPSLNTVLQLAYMANIAPTTKSGVYSTTQTFIGVGKF